MPDFQTSNNQHHARPQPMVSAVLSDGGMIEMLYHPGKRRTALCHWNGQTWRELPEITIGQTRHVPYSPHNNLIRHGVALLPSGPVEYGSEAELLDRLREYVHRYVDVSPTFEQISCYYVLLSWVYDAFNELPYLRVRGDYGSGKTRFLLTVGSVCHKPLFASGASTVSPLFRMMDSFRGTLLLDEGDFRFSDEKAEIIKILNNGNARGFPVLRSEVAGNREFSPQAFSVYGPKIVATRGYFDDRALESRFLTETLGQYALRQDVPINLPKAQREEALELRNQLLLYRFRAWRRIRAHQLSMDRSIEPRLSQIFSPLLSVIGDDAARKDLIRLADQYHRDMMDERGTDIEAQILEVIFDLTILETDPLTVQEIARMFADRFGEDYDRKVTAKWIGWLIRRRLHLKTHKSHGVYVIEPGELPKLNRLFEKYGVGASRPDDHQQPLAG